MTRPTVLVLPGWYPTARQPLSGPFVRDHARAAASCGYDVVVMVDQGPLRPRRGLFELEAEDDGELTVVRFASRPGWGRIVHLPAVLLLVRRLARAGRPVRVIHAHIHWMAWPAVIAGMLLRRPVVVSENSSVWPRRMISRGDLWRARFAFRRAALVCPVNDRLRAAIESYGVEAHFRLVPNAVDTRVFRPYAMRGPSRAAPTRLINVALHVEVKALDVLLRAFAQVLERQPDLTLELIGDGPLTGNLRTHADDLGVAGRVRFRGTATPSEIAAALNESDLFVLSSISENLPLAVLEALCCGVPVAATDVGGVREAVRGDGTLAQPGDAESLAGAIERALTDHARFDRSGIAARAAARYSFEAVGRQWDEIYRSLITAPHADEMVAQERNGRHSLGDDRV